MSVRVTLKDVAEKAGVSSMSVSLALREHTSIPERTRERLKRIATEMGYKPDPMLSALVAHKTNKNIAKYQSTIAFLVPFNRNHCSLRPDGPLRQILEGAQLRANQLGYEIEQICWKEYEGKMGRLSDILHNRGIRGIIIGAMSDSTAYLKLNWKDFSAITLAHGLLKPELHFVSNNNFRSMWLAWHQLKQLRYRRIGLALPKKVSQRSGHEWLASFLLQQKLAPKSMTAIPALLSDSNITYVEIREWLLNHEPDVVITMGNRVKEHLEKLDYKIPKDIGYVELDLAGKSEGLSGVSQRKDLVGGWAVDLMNMMLQRGDSGVQQIKQGISIDGVWVDGKTTCLQG